MRSRCSSWGWSSWVRCKVGRKPVEIGSISNPGDNTTLAKWVGPTLSWKCPTFTWLP
jgi:hypothetical protein